LLRFWDDDQDVASKLEKRRAFRLVQALQVSIHLGSGH
jgi:hypothetical protein